MSRVIELRKAIKALLSAAHPQVYYERADQDAVFPYLVYNLINSIDDGTLENFVLDVDGWDANPDTTALETMMAAADSALHRVTVNDTGKICVTFYRENRLTLTDDDPRIRRRKYIYQARAY